MGGDGGALVDMETKLGYISDGVNRKTNLLPKKAISFHNVFFDNPRREILKGKGQPYTAKSEAPRLRKHGEIFKEKEESTELGVIIE